ncbi:MULTISPECIES: sugar ABC transporter ATP-binding protein [unclassified Crossiella]|uniref:sugar ABC transporter ATP-binding protein n=1 Tax=unclassified Crossiella TaxID=2620835 RepID=UPI001FFF1EE9|nr:MULTISPECIES: sugar ABC transporter ATP-binding protein [unclassified Crossiella]MCK2245020.1 sugar ABC transporter ATP-binding protein [Crossiella sp. S99.2]MCK2258745.1 sugar ABC transporter ATP-binding protein [Crossiella sp. S99.1]
MTEHNAVVEMREISLAFPGVKALQDVDFRLFPGEVHALMGENGAGKSTLIKTLTGVHAPDSGQVRFNGTVVAFSSPAQAQQAGISTVYQEVNLCPNLTVAENILLGREPRRFGRIDGRAMRVRAAGLLARVGLDIDPASALSGHPIAVRQLVAITRAIAVDCRVLVLDEPTSSLDTAEVAELFRIIRVLRDEGVAILFVSHFLDQVYAIADRLTVLRNGCLVGEHQAAELDRRALVAAMLGRELGVLAEIERSARHAPSTAPALMRAEGLGRRGAIAPFDLEIRAGEIVGLAGLLGSGRTELARLLAGADRADTGRLLVDGKPLRRGPRGAIGAGIGFCSEDRKGEGLVAELSVRENLMLALQAARGWTRPLSRRAQHELVAKYLAALDIRPANPDTPAGSLSGGNQQKVLLARWLVTRPRLLILDEPTRGIDVGAKAQIQQLITDLAAAGMAILFISAELEEVVRLADRIVVLRDRRVLAELGHAQAGVDAVVELIAGESAPTPERTGS